jgi:hypothetical protein
MRDLGYMEGRNVAFALRFAEGDVTRLPALAYELVNLNPAVIGVKDSTPSPSPNNSMT